MSYFIRKRRALLRGFDRAAKRSAAVMRERGHPPARIERVHAAARERFAALLPRIPDPGEVGAHLRMFGSAAAIQLALFLAMRDEGEDVAETWAICEEAARRELAGVPSLVRRAVTAVYFSRWLRRRLRRAGAASQEAPLGGWQYALRDGEAGEDFDFAVTYTRCALQELARAVDAAEFGPYLCLGDVVASDLLGWGVQRSETIGHGCGRCDFRFRRGGLTQISTPGWLRRAGTRRAGSAPESGDPSA
ncbi:MAG: L-2-amino-thiazoline-4-carboxylic acid hydrolase [Nannocystaceae bacterium]